ncbi:SDR family NAD(P)-dependent oxidoreductase [Myxococcota bacterium]|nr:SDR family NAD(P)-dependent oxidoreductase [Myxococcota bacterium]
MGLPSSPRAVVTGGAGGLGRAFCLELGRAHGRVVVGDLDVAGAEETARLVRDAGGEAVAVRADVADVADVEALAACAAERFGGVDLLVNNAGVAVAGPIDVVPVADWRWIVDVNLFGVVHGCHVFAPRFKAAGRGHIINVASAAGLVSMVNMSAYNATKAAVVALSETIRGELAPHGVGVTVLCPTFFETGIIDHGHNHGPEATIRLARKLMARSKLHADDVARLALAGAAKDELYVVPMADGRWMWRLKRLAPQLFQRTLVPKAVNQLVSRGGK